MLAATRCRDTNNRTRSYSYIVTSSCVSPFSVAAALMITIKVLAPANDKRRKNNETDLRFLVELTQSMHDQNTDPKRKIKWRPGEASWKNTGRMPSLIGKQMRSIGRYKDHHLLPCIPLDVTCRIRVE